MDSKCQAGRKAFQLFEKGALKIKLKIKVELICLDFKQSCGSLVCDIVTVYSKGHNLLRF